MARRACADPGVRTNVRCRGDALAVCRGQLWTADHDGSVTVRCGATGDRLRQIPRCGDGVFVNCITQVRDAVWLGTTDGRLRAFADKAGGTVQVAEYDLSQGGGPDAALCFARHGDGAYVGTEGGRLSQFGCGLAAGPTLLQHGPSVTAAAAVGPAVWSGDRQGVVRRVSSGTAGAAGAVKAHRCEVAQLLPVWQSGTVWAAGRDGSVVVLDGRADEVQPLAVLPCRGPERPCSLVAVGASVVVAGGSGTLTMWSARERRFSGAGAQRSGYLGTAESGHRDGGVRQMCVAGVVEVASVWTGGADRKLRRVEVTGAEMHPDEREAECVSFLQHWNDSLRADYDALAAREAAGLVALSERTAELAASKRETEAQRLQCTELRSHLMTALDELAAGARERDGVRKDCDARSSDSDKLRLKLVELEKQIQDKTAVVLRRDEDVAAAKRELKEEKHKLDLATSKIKTLEADKGKLTEKCAAMEKAVEKERADVRKAREEEAQQKRLLTDSEKRRDFAVDDLKKEKALTERLRAELEGKAKSERELKQSIESLEARSREIRRDFDATRLELDKTRLALRHMESVAATESRDAGRMADTAVLAKNEADVLRRERDELVGQITVDRSSIDDRDDLVSRLRGQLEVLRDELGDERSNNKQLEDQYTIFQFVINSRGELVTSIWSLHDLLKRVRSSVRDCEDFLKQQLRGVRNQVREHGTACMEAVREAVKNIDEKTTYIIANYFTEYEKLHLGISSYHFYPDTRRPHVVGGELLTRLRQVTPAKQFRDDPPGGHARHSSPTVSRARSDSMMLAASPPPRGSLDVTLSPRRAGVLSARSPVLLRSMSAQPRSPSRR